MSGLTIVNLDGHTGAAIPAQSLDQLWQQAEQLGQVDVDHLLTGNAYRVRIRFERRSGTTVWATGQDINISNALMMAISEALEMGAAQKR